LFFGDEKVRLNFDEHTKLSAMVEKLYLDAISE